METNTPKKLYRSEKNNMIGGVCGGVAEYFNLDPTLVRLALVFSCALAGGGLIAYIVALIIIPKAPTSEAEGSETQASPQNTQPNPAAEGNATMQDGGAATGGEPVAGANTTDEGSPTML